MRKRILSAALIAAVSLGFTAPASAQMAVIDAKAVAQALQTARNTLRQIDQAKELYSSLNSVSNIRNVANILDQPMLQNVLPEGVQSSAALISGDLRDLGAIGTRAEAILGNGDFSLAGLDGRLGDAQGILNRAAQAGARDQAYGEYMLESVEASSEGLRGLNAGLASATTLREAQDVAARAAIENAAISNRLLQMQTLEQTSRAAAAVKSTADFAESQRRTEQNIANGSLWPTWNGQ